MCRFVSLASQPYISACACALGRGGGKGRKNTSGHSCPVSWSAPRGMPFVGNYTVRRWQRSYRVPRTGSSTTRKSTSDRKTFSLALIRSDPARSRPPSRPCLNKNRAGRCDPKNQRVAIPSVGGVPYLYQTSQNVGDFPVPPPNTLYPYSQRLQSV